MSHTSLNCISIQAWSLTIEMDFDMAKSGLDGRNEDDMIDFDTEMADSNQDFEKLDVNLEGADREMDEDEDVVDHHAYETNGMVGEDVEFDIHDVDDTVHSLEPVDYEVSEAPELQKQEPAVIAQSSNEEEQEYDINPVDSNETATQKDDIPDDRASTHEIDYEFEEDAELDKPQQDVTTETTNQPRNSEEEQAVDPAASHKTQESGDNTPVPEQDAVEQFPEERHAPSSHDDHDKSLDPQETPAEHDGAALENVEAEDLAVDDHAQVDTSNSNQEFYEEHTISHEEVVVPGTGHDLETIDEVKAAEDDGYEVGEDEHNEDQLVDTEHAELSASDEDLNVKPNDDFPAITVQYKGDEFPMFSTTTNSFFADTSVLDQPLVELLAGLRTELENEIATDDDLVLQVDELGLELSEATQGELMTDVTFRQVLEIFDVLVKNQDPDSSRTMYTYLFTKPNAEKRLASLFESATAGKGLDEVIHLFETPMTVDTSMLETAATIDGVHEELDEFDSPVDENAGDGQNGNDHHDEADEPEVDAEYPVNEHANLEATTLDVQEVTSHKVASQDNEEVATETQVATPASASTNAEALLEVIEEPNAAIESEDHEQNGKTTSPSTSFICCYYPDFCLCKPCVSGYVEKHNREEREYRQSLKANDGLVHEQPDRLTLISFPYKHAHSISDFSTTFSFNDTDEFYLAHAESDADPFANFELDDDDEVNDNVVVEATEEIEEIEEIEEAEENGFGKPEVTSAQTNGTSTTTTLQEEEEAAFFNIDLGEVSTEAEATRVNTGENDLDEIDWRDEPEADDQEPTTPSAAGKRSRGDDDEHDAEVEQDAKRRRP
ncbi:hypothetical protein FSST1_010912 [Fusarium sambucinum]